MFGYEYGNTRLRAMKSRLLAEEDLRTLARSDDMDKLLIALTGTAYQKPANAALARAGGLEAVSWALARDLVETARKIRGFFTGPERQPVAITLRRYDIHNLKAILRGLAHHAPFGDIQAALLPVGDLAESTLAALAQAPSARAAIDLLASMRLPPARPLMNLRAVQPGASVPEMETALDQWYFLDAAQQMRDPPLGAESLLTVLACDADMVNLVTVLRLVAEPAGRDALAQRSGGDGLRGMFVRQGQLAPELLESCARQPSFEAAVALLRDTPYEECLADGLKAYQASGRLSDFEKQLRKHRACRCVRMIGQDPLGIGVLLGYLALKVTEIANLRWIAHGIDLGLQPAAIWDELEFVA